MVVVFNPLFESVAVAGVGGDSDTLAAIAGPMAYALYREMPAPLVYQALKSLPDWMQRVNAAFDQRCEQLGTVE